MKNSTALLCRNSIDISSEHATDETNTDGWESFRISWGDDRMKKGDDEMDEMDRSVGGSKIKCEGGGQIAQKLRLRETFGGTISFPCNQVIALNRSKT